MVGGVIFLNSYRSSSYHHLCFVEWERRKYKRVLLMNVLFLMVVTDVEILYI